ncbi:hypothetical protein [Paenibacillus sp. NFR01]|uniref:hypothetical protein n=1 Tax=Paenibacillus sp. NFR01 TaxID=1566279 RepID=UPI000B841322|nr:hypothetical protein [Paenibacillus sp. NFR01]
MSTGPEPDYWMRFFALSQAGFEALAPIIFLMLAIGMVLAAVFHKRISDKKWMFLGFDYIALGFIFANIVDFRVRYASLPFICIIVGIVYTFIGLLKKS